MDVPRAIKEWDWPARLEALGWTLIVAAWFIQGYAGVFRRENDFKWHYDRGAEFLAKEPTYRVWYPLARYGWDAGLASMPHRTARGLHFVFASATFAATLLLWRRMLQARWPIDGTNARRAILIALLLSAPYVKRDLDDCGVHLLFLFLATAGIYFTQFHRGFLGGVYCGLAASYKPTAVFLWPFLVWKRQWTAALTMPLAIIAVNLAPAFHWGWDATIKYHKASVEYYRTAAGNKDYLTNPMEPPRHENQSLPFAAARFLQSVPEGHDLYLKHPLFLQFGSLPPETANRIVKALLAAIAVWFAWKSRTIFIASDPTAFAIHGAGACVLIALVSPLCWKQHLVMLLPAILVRVWAAFHREAPTFADKIAMGALVVSALLLPKDVIGRDLATVVASYKVDAFIALFVFALVMNSGSDTNPDDRDGDPSGGREAALRPGFRVQ
jgi:hypothetical protein